MKAFKLLDIETNKIFFYGSVQFHEKIVPLFTGTIQSRHSMDLFYTYILPLPIIDHTMLTPQPILYDDTSSSVNSDSVTSGV